MIFFAFIVTPVYFFAYEILTSVGIAAVNAILIKEYAWKLYFVNMIDTWNDIVFNYCVSQGVETSFAKVNGIAIAGGLCVMSVLCFYYDMFIDGWIITHAVSSSINFVGYLFVWVNETQAETRGLAPLADVIGDFCKYFGDSLNYIGGNYAEWAGWELANVFTGMTQN